MRRLLLILSLALIWSLPAQAGEMAGVTMPDSVSVGGKTLVLNGMGLRTKMMIKVYVAGLYLPNKMNDRKAIIAADTERRLVMQFVRDVGKDKICTAWDEGLVNNTAKVTPELKEQFKTLCTYMADGKDGGKFIFTYVPGKGTSVEVNGAMKGTIASKAFADALFRCWIGANPPGEDFRDGLVGKS